MTIYTVVISPKTTLTSVYKDASTGTIYDEAVLVTAAATPPNRTVAVIHSKRSGPGGLSPRAAGVFLGVFLGCSFLVVLLVFYCCVPRRRQYRSETSSSSRSSTSSLTKPLPQVHAGPVFPTPSIKRPQAFFAPSPLPSSNRRPEEFVAPGPRPLPPSLPTPLPPTAQPFTKPCKRPSGKNITPMIPWIPQIPAEPMVIDLPPKDKKEVLRRGPGTAVPLANKQVWVRRPTRPKRNLPPAEPEWDPPPE